MSRRFRALVVVFVSFVSLTTLAQVRYRPTETGPWRPWSFSAIESARQSRAATATEVQAFQARLQELAAIVKRAPAVSTPIGFAGELWGSLSSYSGGAARPAGRSVPLAGVLTFGAFPLIEFERGGKKVNEDLKGGETELLQFVVNQIDGAVYGGGSKPGEWGATDIDAFVEPASGTAIAGLPRVGDVFIVQKNPKPLWVAFPIGEALQPIATQRRETYEQQRDNYARQVAEFTELKSPVKRAARRAEWKQAAASMPPSQGEQFIANMEKSDPQIEAAKEAQLGPGGPEDTSTRAMEAAWKEVDGILAALSADARRAPACFDQRAGRLADRFRAAAGAPASCRALVRPNADYFDAKLPRSAPQVVMVSSFTRCLRPEAAKSSVRGGCVINRTLVETIEWESVRAWLDR